MQFTETINEESKSIIKSEQKIIEKELAILSLHFLKNCMVYIKTLKIQSMMKDENLMEASHLTIILS